MRRIEPVEINTLLKDHTRMAVAHYWHTRTAQSDKQEQGGKLDQGLRGAVTGGGHMDGFINIFSEIIQLAGMPKDNIFQKRAIELPDSSDRLRNGIFSSSKIKSSLQLSRPNPSVAHLSGTTSTTEPKRRWGVHWIYGPPIESRLFLRVHNRFSATFLCWKNVPHQSVLLA